MPDRPKLLDLFCGAGGAAMGYYRAGFDVTGVDIKLQPRYPFEFIQADALEYVSAHWWEYDFIHASPPCQRYTAGRRAQRAQREDDPHPDLIGPTRVVLQALRTLYVIENVEGSPLLDPIRLCGQQFGLRVIRHRLFESNLSIQAPQHQKHTGSMLDGSIVAVYGRKWIVSGPALRGEDRYHVYGRIPLEFRTVEARQQAMQIDWMTGTELNEAIPPAYTEYIGKQLLSASHSVMAAAEPHAAVAATSARQAPPAPHSAP